MFVLIKKALEGDVIAAREVLDRVLGKAKVTMEVQQASGEGGFQSDAASASCRNPGPSCHSRSRSDARWLVAVLPPPASV